MADTTQHLLGQLADGRFPLRKLLGVSANSAVFLTSVEAARHTEPAPDAAIKLIPEDPANSEILLKRWRDAADLRHPGLLRILHSGRCVIDGSPCLYVVSELADEDLGQLLPQRALTPDEASGMLAPVLETLDYLHEKGLEHGGVKPSNIHAIGNQVKLSSDRILPAGESSNGWPLASPYAAPESILFPASDIWSLGITLCETLTRRLPEPSSAGNFALPVLPGPFSEIVGSALVADATLRIRLDSVRSLLDPTFVPKTKPAARIAAAAPSVALTDLEHAPPEALIEVVQPASVAAHTAAAATGASRTTQRAPLPQIDPLSVPLSPVEPPSKPALKASAAAPSRAPIPVSTLPHVNATIAGPRRAVSPNPSSSRSNTLFLVAAAAAILLAIVVVPRMLVRSNSAPATASNGATPPANVADSNRSTANPGNSKSAAEVATKPAASSRTATTETNSTSSAPPKSTSYETAAGEPKSKVGDAASTAVGSAAVPTAAPSAAKPAISAPTRSNAVTPTIVRKILPEVSEKARSTISGTVRINVRVELNADGTVSSAELNTPASSKFFADLALKAAKQWQLGADDSAAMPSSAVIRFDFTPTATSAYLP